MAYNPESKTALDSFSWGDFLLVNKIPANNQDVNYWLERFRGVVGFLCLCSRCLSVGGSYKSNESYYSGILTSRVFLRPGIFTSRVLLRPAILASGYSYVQGFLHPGILTCRDSCILVFLRPGILTFRVFLRPGILTSGYSYVQGFLHPGILTSRDSYIQGILTSRDSCIRVFLRAGILASGYS